MYTGQRGIGSLNSSGKKNSPPAQIKFAETQSKEET